MSKKFTGLGLLVATAIVGSLSLSQTRAMASPLPTTTESSIERFAQNSGAEDYFRQGVELAQKEDLNAAETAFRKAIELNPNFAEAYANLGSVLANQNKLAEAIPNFEKAVSLKPDVPVLHYLLGNALFDQNRPAEAGASFKKARDLLREQGKTQEADQLDNAIKEAGL